MSQLRFQTNIFFDTIMQMILMSLSLIFSLIWQFIYSNLIYFRYYPFTSHFICGSLQVFISKRKHILHVEKWMLQLHFQTARFIDTIMQIFLSFLSHIFSGTFKFIYNHLIYFICGHLYAFIWKWRHIIQVEKWMLQLLFLSPIFVVSVPNSAA